MGNRKKLITNLILFFIFIACTFVVMNNSVITDSLKGISNKRNDGTNLYRVSFISNGGKWTSGSDFENGYIDYSYGDLIDEPTDSDITHNGCTLEGWYTDSNYTNKWNFTTGTIDQNMTLYANWERNIYTVEFREIYDDYTGEDVVLDSVEVPYGYTLVLDGEASDETLTFKYNGPELSTTNFKNWISSTGTYTITQDTVFFARYENENVYVLNVNYLFQNGAVASHNKVTTLIEGGTYNLDTPVIRGYTPSTNNINGVLNQTSVAAFQADDETGNADNVEVKKVDDTTYYVTYFILFTPNQTTYKVNHYLQKVDLSGYDLQESIEYDETIIDGNSMTVYVGDKINPILNTYEGFTHNTERSDLTGKALPDGEAELNQYYDRNTYYIYASNTGDSYFDPIPVLYGASISFEENVTRSGYNFNGWTWSYSLGGEAISPLSIMPAKDIYISANWTETTTTYIFSYYEEYANSDAYVNIGNIEQTGTTGTNLSTLNLTNSIQNGFNSLEDENQYFNYNSAKTLEQNNNLDIVISGDGTTKINIYFSRNRYNLVFDLNDSGARTKARLTMDGENYTTATQQYSFVAKYNQDISTLWPTATDFTQNPSSGSFNGWKRSGTGTSTYVSMRNSLTYDMLASSTNGSTSTYQAQYISSGNNVHLYYMVESFDQTSPATTTRRQYSGVYYDSIPEYEQTVKSSSTGFSAKELPNLTKAGNESTTSGNGNNRVYTYYFYYSRNTMNLTFWNVIENDTNLSTSLPYGSDLSSYASSVPNEYPIVTPGEGEWTFDQWYQDPDCTIPMDFDTELETNLTLYAKWIPPQYNVTFNVNEGEWNDVSSTYTNNGDGTYSYSVDEATVMTPPTEPTRYGYTFDGWYYDAEIDGVQRNIRYIFDESQKVYNDLSLEAHWSNSLYVQYRVKYIKGQKDINGDLITDINQYTNYETVLDDKVVTNILFDSTVTEQAANVVHAGEEIYYLADSQFKTLKLDAEDEEDNIIYFFYDSSDEAYYTVYYLRYNNKEYDRSETPDPTEYLAQPKTITLKTAADGTLVSERAETIFGYTVRDNWFQELQLVANQDHNKMFFYYDNNSEYGDYSVNIYLMDSGTETYGNTPTYTYAEYGIVGSTIFSNSYLGREYIPISIWDTYKLDSMYSDTYIIISDGEDVVTDLNIYLKLKDYTITYQLDGGTWNEESNLYRHNDSGSEYYELVKTGNTCTEPTDPTKPGYTFLGWFDEDDNEFDFSTTITSDLTLIAKWNPRTDLSYTVKYIDNAKDIEIQTQKVVPNNTAGTEIDTSTEVISIIGYTYDSCNVDTLTISGDESENVIELYYTPNNVPYTVNHWGQKEGGDASIHDAENYDLVYPETLYGEANAEVTPDVYPTSTYAAPSTQTVTIAPDGSTVVNYYYTRNGYTLTLYKGLGIEEVYGAGSYQAGATVSIDALVKDGYVFRAWTDCDCGGVEQCQCNPCNCNEVTSIKQYSFEMFDYNFARTAEARPIVYTISYDGNGATSGSTESSIHTFDEPKTLTPNGFEREYTITYDYNYEGAVDTTDTVVYEFDGWNCTEDGSGNSYDDEQEVLNIVHSYEDNQTITAYAQWTPASSTNLPTRTGYIFAGWYEDEDTTGNRVDTNGEYTPTADKTLYAKWVIDPNATKELSYTVEYYKDGIIVPGDTQVVTDTVQVTDPDIITVIKENINTINKYEGYRLDSTEPNPIPDTIASGSTIKVKYVKRTDLTGTVNHYWTKADGTNPVLHESTSLTGLTFNDVLTGENYKNTYAGYTYHSSNPATITVSAIASDNVINLYYKARTDVPYTVNHWGQKIGADPSIHNEENYTLEEVQHLYGEANSEVTPEVGNVAAFTAPATQTVTISPDGSTVVNYYYTRNSFELKLYKGKGIESVVGAGTYEALAPVTIDAVVKEGYTWRAWTDCDCGGVDECQCNPCNCNEVTSIKQYTFDMFTYNFARTAEATPNTYTITYDGNGATGGSTETSTHTYDEAKNLTPNGYEREYTITYDYNYDGKDNTTKTVAYGFNGWNDAQDGSGNSYNNEAEVLNWLSTDNANKDIYAQWTTSSNTNTPTREGYIFAGWYDNEETTGSRLDINGEYTPSADITLYAKWEIDNNSTKTLQYTVEYYKDNVKVEADTMVVTDVVQVLQPDTITVNSTLINENDKYEGYRLDHTDPATVPSVVNTGTTIKVYYVKRSDLTGTINHYLTKADGTNATLKESIPLTGLIYNDVLTGENYQNTYAGYTYYSSIPETIIVDELATYNVINLYYRANTDVPYTVNYWIQKEGGDPSIHDEINYELENVDVLYGEANTEVTPEVYHNTAFISPSPQTVIIAPDGSTVVNYYYPMNMVRLTLRPGVGIESVSGAGIYQAGSEVTIDAVVKAGYTWDTWNYCTHDDCSNEYPCEDNNIQLQKRVTFPMFDTPITAVAEATPNTDTPYIVRHWTQNVDGDASIHDGANYTIKDTDNLQGTTDTQVTPETKTYTGFTSPSTQTITISGTGSTVVNYYYTRNSYDVTTDKDSGIATVTGAGSYLYEAEVTLTAEVKDGYTWKEWTGDKPSSDQTYIFTMPADNIVNKANTTINTYSITYTLNDGTLAVDNPTSYTVETDSFTLNNPSKTGYTFIGWTGSNGTTSQKNVQIAKGTTGNLEYVANYSANTDTAYVVKHWTQNLTGDGTIHDNVNYTLKDTDNLQGTTDTQVTPDVMSYTGFTVPSTQTVTIAADGSTIVDYYYTRNSYNVSLDKDDGIATVTGAGSYLYEAEVTITAEVKDGYTWKDWTGTKPSTTKNYTFTMPADNVDNKANTTINTYSITYTLNDGEVEVDNPTSYTVETDTFTLNNPSKIGYIFTGWTGSNGTTPQTNVTISKGTIGNLEYVANYNPITYTITYDGNGATGGNTEPSTHTYDEIKNLTPNGYERKYTITYDYNYDEQADTTQTVAYGFNGWNDVQDGSGNSYNNEAEVLNWLSTDNANKDIYAQWTTSSNTNTPTREGYVFAGWYDNEETTGNRLDVNGEYIPTSDITLYAKWEIDNNSTKTLQYTVEYYKDNVKVEADTMVVTDVVQVLQPDTITVNSTLINENDKYEGYRLDHTDPGTVPSVVNTGTTIKVYYVKRSDLTGTINHYLTKADGTNATLKESTPLAGLTYNDVLTGENYQNTYVGYTYYSSNPETIVVEVSAINNVINLYYRANTNTSYIVKHWTQNLTGDASIHDEVNYTLKDTDPLNGETNTQVTPETKTYTGFTSPSTQTITISGTGSTVVNYYYTRNSYDVTTDKDNGIATVTGAGSYLYEAEVTLTAEVKDGYTWKDWTGNKPSSDQTYTFTMPADNVENKANTTINTYSITYTLNDGTLVADNPTSYTVETDSFTLNNPSKTGYTFIGWTGSNGTTPNVSVTIPKGTTGNLEYVANYSANTDTSYIVRHWIQDVDGDASIHDDANYTIKDTDNLQGTTDTQVTPPVKTTYTGFTAPSTQTVTIAADGSTVVDYYYTRNSYNVILDKDNGIATVTGAGSYLYEAEVTITAEVKDGYTWKDWTGDKASSDQTYIFTMPANNVESKANTTINTYSITYTLNDGEVEVDNPTSYTVETDSFTLNNPSKTGYIFTGWTGSNGTTPEESVTIPKGTTGNIEYVANYNPITYTITYDGNGATGGETETSNHTYDVPKNLTPNGYERKYTITYDYNYDEQADTTKTVSYGFNGWNDTPDGSGNSYNNEAEVLNWLTTNNDNKVIYADWTSTSDTNNPTRFGYIFAGWYEDEATTGNRVDTNGEYTPTSDKTLYAKWIIDDGNTKEVSYTVEYYKDGTIVPEDTQVVTDTIQVLEPDIITVVKENINTTNKYEGYRLDNVEPNPIPNTIASGSTIKVKYVKRTDLTGTINHYLTKADGTNATLKESTPLTGLTYNDVLTGENYKNTYAGYTYYSSNPETIVVEVSAINNVINLYYRANTNTSYTVKHWTQNLTGEASTHDEVNYTLQDTDPLNGETNTQVTPETKTYTGFTSPSAQTVTIAGDGSTVVNYYYTRNSYDVTTDKDNGIATVTGAGSYLYEAEVTLTAEVKDGYTWKEWTGDRPSSDQTYIFTMPANNVENKANTTINTYSITYTLNDGTLAVDNPTSYTVETDSFTLNNPSKTGYTFIGWTGSNGTTPQTNVTISKGTTGNLEYVANYSANTNTAYVVKHWTQNITGDGTIHDNVNYTLKDTDNLQGTTDTQVTPAVKSYTGFTAPSTQTVTIAADGSTVVDYYYTRNSYNVTLDKDDGIATVTGAGSYLYEAEVTITAEVKDGYTWKDWTGDKASSDQTYIFTMPANNVDNKANTTINTYSITYTLNDGEVEVDNPTSYTVETDTFTLNNPSKIGYIFTGWTGSNGTTPEKNVTVSKGTTGNIEYVANYDPITYTVEYDGNGATGGQTEPSTHIYDVAKNLTPNGYERKYTITYDYNYDEKENTTKTVAYSFAVWSDGRTRRLYNDEESVINLISTNNGTKTIYAIWDEASDTNLPTRTGYKFEGWYDNEETTGNRVDTNGEYTPTSDITLYAKWSVDDSQEKELKYTLEYYKDNVLAESKDYTKTVQVLEPDTLEVNKSEINTTDKYVGYDFVSTDPATIPDVVESNSTIKVYYEIKDYLTYTVKYIDVDINEEIKTAKPVGNQTYNTVVNTSTEVIDIDGYNFDHPEVASITISTNESTNIINLYYKKAKFNYTVEYYYDNIIDNTKTDTFQATYKDKISTYQAKAIDGYTLDKVEPAELEIGYVAANNVMRVYYKKAKFNYTVEYYYDNVIDSTKTETKQATYKDTISTYTSKNITGYALNNVANLPLTISSNEANNIIKVYYVRAPYNYTVNYYFNNVIRPDLSETHAALFNDSINTYDDKVEVGYKLDRVETLPLVVTENNDANILSVYYITDPNQTKELKYTIKYYKDGVESNSDEYTKTVQVLENDIIEVDKTKINTTDKYDGYYFVNTDPSTIPDEVTTGTIIKVNYTIRNDLSYTVEYWDKDENETIKTSKVVNNQTFNSEILSTSEKINIDGYDYDSVSVDSITIKTDNSLNIIKFYYTKRTNLEYKVNYLLKDSDNDDSNNEVIHSQKVQGNMIFKSVVTSSNEVIDIDGYNYDSVNVGSITISANVEQNIINIFYNKRTDLKYTVNYLEKDSDDDDSNNKVLMTQKVQENQTFGTIINSANEVIAIAGYNYLAPSVNSISVKTEEALNVITLYYTPRTDLSYKVNYLLKDSDDDDSNNTVLHASKTVSNQSYLAEINPTDEEVFVTGYKVASYSSNPLVIGLGENVLTIYYSKDESQTDTIDYTIQYYKDGVIVPTDTENISSTIYILDKITFTPNVNKYEGYNYDSVNSIIPEYVTDGAVIKVYYTSRTDLSYTVQYLQKETSDVLHSAKVYGNQTYGDSIVSANEVISIDGYNYDSSNVPNLVIGTNENENIIKLYYTKRTDLSYVVNYLELSTNKVLHSQKVYNNITFDSEIKSADEIISINGYKYDSVNLNSIKIKTNVSQNVINIYYTKVTGLAYTVRYLDKSSNEEIATAKVVENQTFEDEILTSNEIVSIDGYTYNSTNVDKLIIGTNNTENVIKIYYNKRNDLSYSVKYIDKDTNTQIQSPKVVNNQVFNTQIIASSEIEDIIGYNFDHLNVDNLSIGTGQNVIIVYYSKVTGLSYKVNYLLLDNDEDDSNNVKLAESKIGSNKTYKDEINPANEEKVITGYKVAKYSSNPLVITTDESKNVLTIYYEKDETQTKDINYTIEYYKEDISVPTDIENYSSTIYVLDEITFTPNVNKYEGYEFDSVNSIIPNSIGDGQVIKVLYTKRKDLSYKVNYYEKGTNVILQEPLQVTNVPYEKVVKLEDVLKDIPGYNFAEADNSEITIGVNIELNVINVFYTKRTDLSYIVKYIDKDTGEEIKYQKVVPQKLLGEVIDSKDEIINVDGYNYDSVEEDYLTIGASLNEMKIYYTKRNDIEYTIEYYFDDVLDPNLTENIKAIYLQKIDEYKKAQRKGYTLDKEESFPLTISYIQEDNIIKIFYKRIVVPIRITSIDRITGRIIDYYEIGSRYGDEYIVNEKEFDGYNYVGTPSNIVGLTDTEVIDVTFYYEPLQEKSNSNNNTNNTNSNNSVIRVQDTGLNVISYNIIIGVIFITIGMTVLIIYTSKDKKNKETKAKF